MLTEIDKEKLERWDKLSSEIRDNLINIRNSLDVTDNFEVQARTDTASSLIGMMKTIQQVIEMSEEKAEELCESIYCSLPKDNNEKESKEDA